jgi:beta-fructofuranosidase
MTVTKSVPWWQGAHSIPRVISLKNNRVWQEPVPEIAGLRGQHHHCSGEDVENQIRKIRGDALEIMASFNPGVSGVVGLRLRVSDDGEDYVRAYYDPAKGVFGVDGPTITRNQEEIQNVRKPRPGSQRIETEDGERINMHIFLDRSLLEMYINGYAITSCFFSHPEAMNIEIEGEPDQLVSLDVWEMGSIWDGSPEKK